MDAFRVIRPEYLKCKRNSPGKRWVTTEGLDLLEAILNQFPVTGLAGVTMALNEF